ncbi:hypothetical protein, partial [Hyalangium sp.]|uniref:hypothetical protein n=1 Tax=Hyalangium sp. TaxID=2028555 RepID=UPI002D648A7A
KSKEYVYGRLKLCELNSPTARRLLDEGRVEPSTALLIARIPGEKLQERAAMAILKGGAWDDDREEHGPMSFRAAKDVVQREYMLQLSKAPFNTKDAQLEPEAGACGPCPKRTGNCKALYPDVKSENVCTDPECFGKKKAVAFKAEAAAAKEKGQRLLKESKALWDYEGKRLGYRGQEKYVELTDKLPGDKKGRTFKELLGEKAPVVLARDPNGKVHQLLEKERLEEALAAAGHKVKVKDKSSGRGNDDYAKQQEEERFRHRVVQRLLSAVFSKINAGKVDELTALRSLAGWLYQTEDPELQSAWQERAGADHQVRKYIDEAPRALLVALLFESLLYEELSRTWNGYHHRTKEVCALAGVELDAVEKEQQAADKAAAANPPANGREGIKAEGEDLEEDGEDA